MRVLVLGATGMLGSAMVRILNEKKDLQVFGTARSNSLKNFFRSDISERLLFGVDVEQTDALVAALAQVKPDVVINCIGLVKQLDTATNPLQTIPINTLFPHRLAMFCELSSARLIHISTDCVFSGKKGNYKEADVSDASDLYGKSKYLGEVVYPHTVTIRTSIIGHELQSAHGLVEWFLSQHQECNGYTKAIFSGLPTVVLAQIIRDVVIPRRDLSGIYHVAGNPISKYDLLRLIAAIYDKQIKVIPDPNLVIDRSLNSEHFYLDTGYVAPDWPELIKTMNAYK